MKTKAKLKGSRTLDISPAEHGRIQNSASLVALAIKINQEHAEFEAAREQAIKWTLETINRLIRIGCYLETAKDEIGHGKWLKWVKDNCPFSERSARNYVTMAVLSNRQAVADLLQLHEFKKAMILFGLREPETLQDQQHHEFNPFEVFSQAVCKASGLVTKALEKRPVAEWPRDARDQAKELLKPLVEVYGQL